MESVSEIPIFQSPSKGSNQEGSERLTSRSNGQRTLDRCQLIGLDEARMSQVGDIAATGLEHSDSVLGLKKKVRCQLSWCGTLRDSRERPTPKQYPIAPMRSQPRDFMSLSTV